MLKLNFSFENRRLSFRILIKFPILMNLLINSDEVRMWVYEETLPSGEKLTDVINKTNVRTAMHSITILWPILFNRHCYFYDCSHKKEKKNNYCFLQENVKYLPGIKLGKNVVADPDLGNAGNGLVFF